mgnify:FL=1
MNEIMKIFQVVQNELQMQSKDINKCIDTTSKEINNLENKFMNIKLSNQNKLENSSGIQKQQIEKDIKFNQNLYELELNKKYLKKTYYQNQLKSREMYFARCSTFVNYMVALSHKNEIQMNQTFFSFINHVCEEFVKNYQYLRDYYVEKKRIHEKYVFFLSSYPLIDEKRRTQIEKNILSEKEYQDIIDKINELDQTLNEYKEIFKTKKPKITKKIIESNTCFNFEILNVVESIYQGVKKNEVHNTK